MSSPERSLEGKVCLVTGGTKQGGAAIARRLAEQGAHVVLNYFHDRAAAARTLEEFRAAGLSAELCRASVARPQDVDRMFAAIEEAHGRLDVLVNSAVYGVFKPFADILEREWRRMTATCFDGTRLCSQRALPLLRGRRGSIVNISSLGAGMVVGYYAGVGPMKAAVEALTRYLAVEFAPYGVRVNAVSCGMFDGAWTHRFPDSEAMLRTTREATPLGRLSSTQDQAEAVAYLVSDAARWITGQTLTVDGGASTGFYALSPPGYPRASRASEPAPYRTPAGEGTAPSGLLAEHRAAPAPAKRHHTPSGQEGEVAIVGVGLLTPGAGSADDLWEVLRRGEPRYSDDPPGLDLANFSGTEGEDKTRASASGLLHGSGRVVLPDTPGTRPPLGSLDWDIRTWVRHAVAQALSTCSVGAEDRAYLALGLVPEAGRQLEESLVRDQVVRLLGGSADTALSGRLDRALPRSRGVLGALPHHVARDAVQGLLPAGTRIEAIDAACASALYTIDSGADAILHGEADIALCGGAFATSPRYMVLFDAMHGLSRSGRLKAFDADADGTVISDGSVVLVLKSHRRARRDGDTVFGLVLGFGGACDGRGKAINASDPRSQRLALDRALARSGTEPEGVDWVLAHATGTRAGDRSELSMLRDAAPDTGWIVSANKALVGHTGPASGGVSVVQALLGLRHHRIPAQRPATAPAGDIAPLAVPDADTPWPPRPERPRRAAVAAYGIGGANAFVILGEPHPASPPPARKYLTDDPVVVVAWSADLPGDPTPSQMEEGLRTGTYRWPPSYGDRYRFSGAEFRMPRRAVRTMDRTQPMTLRCAEGLAARLGPALAAFRDTTGVVYASSGPTRAYAENALRCYLDQLATALDARVVSELARDVRAAVPPTNADSLTGGMANIPGGRAANHLDVRGLSVRFDAGRDSALAALAATRRFLRAGDLDLVLLLSANGVTSPAVAGALCSGGTPATVAEGAFGLALTRRSVAREHDLPVLATLTWPGLDDRAAVPPGDSGDAAPRARSWLGADAAVDVLGAVVRREQHLVTPVEDLGQPAVLVLPPGSGAGRADTVRGERSAGAPPSPPPRIRRHVLTWVADQGTPGAAPALDALPAECTLVTNVSRLEGAASPRRAVICPASHGPAPSGAACVPAAELDTVALSEGQRRHLRVLVDLAAGMDDVLATHELVFAAVRRSFAELADHGSCVVVVFNARGSAVSGACEGMFTGMVKSMALELPGCLSVCVVSDTDRPREALTFVGRESGRARRLPVVRYVGGVRRTERWLPEEAGADDAAGGLELDEDCVVLAVGGGRGVTRVLTEAVARRWRPHLWVLGTTRPYDIPAAELAAIPQDRRQFIADRLRERSGTPLAELVDRYEELRRARQVQEALAVYRQVCGEDRVHYRPCDITDRAAVFDVVNRVVNRHGRVDLVLQGAGISRSGRTPRKTLAEFTRVRDIVVRGHRNLVDALAPVPPRRWLNVGSFVALVGSPGVIDYASAHGYLLTSAEQASVRHGWPMTTVAWPYWTDVGLAASPIHRGAQQRRAVFTGIDNAEGAALQMAELRARGDDPVVILAGDAELRSSPGEAGPADRPRHTPPPPKP